MRRRALGLCVAVLLGMFGAGCGMMGGDRGTWVDPLMAAQETERQRQIEFTEMQRKARRLKNVEWQLISANADLCGGHAVYELGFGVWSLELFPEKDRLPAKRAFGLDDRLKVSTVADGSPARYAGMVVGDVVLAMQGEAVAPGAKGASAFLKRLDMLLRQGKEMTFTVERGGEPLELAMTPRKTCPYRVQLMRDDAVNALSDGENLIITEGMLRYTENDDQLGLVLAREMARNALGEAAQRQKAALAESVTSYVLGYMTGFDFTGISQQYIGTLSRKVGGQFFNQQTEEDADYLGLYYAARAGVDVEKAPYFWRKVAVSHPQLMSEERTATVERLLKMDEIVAEIETKRSGGMAVAPTLPRRKGK